MLRTKVALLSAPSTPVNRYSTRHVVRACASELPLPAPTCDRSGYLRSSLMWHLVYASDSVFPPEPGWFCAHDSQAFTNVFLPSLYVNPNFHVLIQVPVLSQGPLSLQIFWPTFSEILFHLYKPQILSSWRRRARSVFYMWFNGSPCFHASASFAPAFSSVLFIPLTYDLGKLVKQWTVDNFHLLKNKTKQIRGFGFL